MHLMKFQSITIKLMYDGARFASEVSTGALRALRRHSELFLMPRSL